MLYLEWFSFNPFKAHCYTAEEIQRLSARLELRLDKVITESAALEKRIREVSEELYKPTSKIIL